jgi:hypothetical protein
MNPFEQLEIIAARTPRYDSAYGICALCRLGATRLEQVFSITWCTCQPCGTRWPSAVQSLSPRTVVDLDDSPSADADAQAALDEEIAYAAMLELAACVQLPEPTEGEPMRPSAKPSSSRPPSLALLQAVRGCPGNATLLQGVPDAACLLILEGALALLVGHPHANRGDADRLAHQLWNQQREIRLNERGETVETALTLSASGPLMQLRMLFLALLHHGSLEQTLLAQRAAIDAQLARLGVPVTS